MGWFPQSYVRPAPMEARESMSATQPANMEEMMKTGTVIRAVDTVSSFKCFNKIPCLIINGEKV